ncbi:TetR/AcrR family transcriptional regulator [Acinetobacter wuhouensis]|uniref:TetR/AcrR family transcriptional regulator n=1 Tax=Acinetobacter wuhouensis TaxID=1879050 RepID=A0A3G2T1J9_9GAMM|nr:TetR/AcrR family transcriptional regulator [Acinetobacter wuhouensis]AYO53636.1 TetR/AcrR family transcriptional regulator [Acinetobacter wuhouensis]
MQKESVQIAPRRQRRRNESNPQKILETTLELMSNHGYSGTSISMISELSGYPVTSIYWHFGNKEQLLLAALEYGAIEDLNRKLKYLPENSKDIEQQLVMIDADFLKNPPKVLRMMFMIGLEDDGSNENIQKAIKRIRGHARQILIQHIEGLAAQQGALLSTKMINAIANMALAIGDGFILANQIEPEQVNIELGCEMQVKVIKQLIKEYKK